MYRHILQYNRSLVSFKDVAPNEFFDSGTHGLRWLTVARQTIAVTADQELESCGAA
jgi:hypothetical protein